MKSEYKGNYRVVEKECRGCGESKEMPTRNKFCSRECSGKKKLEAPQVAGGPKILFLDIETFPNLVNVWRLYESNALDVERYSITCCFSAKWLDGKQVTKGLPDYSSYKDDPFDDRELVQDIWDLLNEADICIAHNGDSFDFKKVNARFAFHQMPPPTPYKTIDTKKVAKSNFSFESNKLTSLGEYLGLGVKVDTGGFKLWQDCMLGKPAAWSLMKKYNAHDVVLLEKIYLRLRPWVKSHINIGMYSDGKKQQCPKCGSSRLQSRGVSVTNTSKYQRVQCQDCGGWGRFNINLRLKSVKPVLSL